MKSCRSSTRTVRKSGTRRRQQFAARRFPWNVRFLRNRALDCEKNEVCSSATRRFTSSTDSFACWPVSLEIIVLPSLTMTLTVASKVSPGARPSGIVTWNCWPSAETSTFWPAWMPSGHVTVTVLSFVFFSIVDTGIRLPSLSVPHTTWNVVPRREVSHSSCPSSTPTCSPVLRWTMVVWFVAFASSASAFLAMVRKTSSSDDMPTWTSTIPSSAARVSS
mmetsp:Transcript_20374/g.47294  ORF Transcript_20374/g.47294 Transcript_20374/m.47294 type:complete len:220 (-) Transcript_20374:21-680(-)